MRAPQRAAQLQRPLRPQGLPGGDPSPAANLCQARTRGTARLCCGGPTGSLQLGDTDVRPRSCPAKPRAGAIQKPQLCRRSRHSSKELQQLFCSGESYGSFYNQSATPSRLFFAF